MASDLVRLSIAEIRARYVDTTEPVSPRVLTRLKQDRRRGVRNLYETLRRRLERQREERLRLDGMRNFERILWKSGTRLVAGVDEVGVGPLAGPVVASAVVFAPETGIQGIDDSKRLEPRERARLAETIRSEALGIGLGEASVEEIDRLNVYHASVLAMRRAVEALPERPQHVLVDARTIPDLDVPQNAFQKGDGLNYSIAAASIVAKEHRDRLMEALDEVHPGYGFARHKGYGTSQHQEAIRRLGPSPVHRQSYSFLRELRGEFSDVFYELKKRLEGPCDAATLATFEEELANVRDQLSEAEQKKLKTLLLRRWKRV